MATSAVACLLTPALVVLCGGRELPLPAVLRHLLPVPLAPLSALVVVLALGRIQTRRSLRETVSARPIMAYEALAMAGLAAAAAGLCVAVEQAGWTELGVATARNCLGLAGVVMLVGTWSPRHASLLTTSYAVAMAAFARTFDAVPERWAWVVAGSGNVLALWWALALGLGGVMTMFIARRRPRPSDG